MNDKGCGKITGFSDLDGGGGLAIDVPIPLAPIWRVGKGEHAVCLTFRRAPKKGVRNLPFLMSCRRRLLGNDGEVRYDSPPSSSPSRHECTPLDRLGGRRGLHTAEREHEEA